MTVLSQLSEEVPVWKDPLFGEYFDLYGTKYVKKRKMVQNGPN